MNETPGTAVAVAARPTVLLRPIAKPTEIMEAQNETRAMIRETLTNGRDFGTVPGTDKRTLLKPGAERVSMAFGCVPRFTIVEKEVDHNREVRWLKAKWVTKPKPTNHEELKARGAGRNRKFDERWVWQEKSEEEGLSLGLYRYVIECALVHRESGVVVGQCIASCSSMESKYIDRPRDSENTVVKMAQKRAFVGANLVAFGLSDEFTQDVEDAVVEEVAPIEEHGGEPPSAAPANHAPSGESGPVSADEPTCPKCGERMWDNRLSKTNPKAPDYKCRNRTCDGVLWPGQFPPTPMASAAQRTRITAALATAKLTENRRQKLHAELADTEKPMNAKRADELIAKLEALVPAAEAKEPAGTAARAASTNGDHNTIGGEEMPF